MQMVSSREEDSIKLLTASPNTLEHIVKMLRESAKQY